MDYSTIYSWEVTVDDGVSTPTTETYSFTTEAEMTVRENTIPFDVQGSTVTSDGSIFLIRPSNDVYKSIDNGYTWTYVSSTPRSAGHRNMYCTSQDTLLAADFSSTGGQIHRSTNLGVSWSTVITLGNNEAIWSFDEYDGKLYASVYTLLTSSNGHARVMVSSDDGSSWSLLKQFDSKYRHAHGLFVNKYNGYIYVALGDPYPDRALMRSTDGGSTWTNLESVYLFTSINAYPDSNVVYVGRDGYPAIYRFVDDGGSSITLTPVYDNGGGNHNAWEKENVFWMVNVNGRLVFGEVVDSTDYPVVLGISSPDWMSFTKVLEKSPDSDWTGFPYATSSYWPLSTIIIKSDALSGDMNVILSWE